MNIYSMYYIDAGERYYFMKREDAMNCGITYIHQVAYDEDWDAQETESVIDEFLREEWIPDICALEIIRVKE